MITEVPVTAKNVTTTTIIEHALVGMSYAEERGVEVLDIEHLDGVLYLPLHAPTLEWFASQLRIADPDLFELEDYVDPEEWDQETWQDSLEQARSRLERVVASLLGKARKGVAA